MDGHTADRKVEPSFRVTGVGRGRTVVGRGYDDSVVETDLCLCAVTRVELTVDG